MENMNKESMEKAMENTHNEKCECGCHDHGPTCQINLTLTNLIMNPNMLEIDSNIYDALLETHRDEMFGLIKNLHTEEQMQTLKDNLIEWFDINIGLDIDNMLGDVTDLRDQCIILLNDFKTVVNYIFYLNIEERIIKTTFPDTEYDTEMQSKIDIVAQVTDLPPHLLAIYPDFVNMVAKAYSDHNNKIIDTVAEKCKSALTYEEYELLDDLTGNMDIYKQTIIGGGLIRNNKVDPVINELMMMFSYPEMDEDEDEGESEVDIDEDENDEVSHFYGDDDEYDDEDDIYSDYDEYDDEEEYE